MRIAKTLILGCASVLFVGMTTAPAFATDTLAKIASSGAVKLGVRDSAPPFAYLDKDQKPLGYSVDICLKVVEAIKAELKRPELKVEYKTVTSGSRVSAMAAGEIDLECGSTTNTAERRVRVAFTIPTFIAGIRLLVHKESKISKLFDLTGKKVVVSEGSGAVKLFGKINEMKKLNAEILTAKNPKEAFEMLEAKKVDAFITNDVLLASMRASSKTPDDYIVTGELMEVAPLAIALPKDDPAFKKVVDTEVTRVILSGEINGIYKKWFESPIPPDNLNLQLPMNYFLRDSFKTPTDYVP